MLTAWPLERLPLYFLYTGLFLLTYLMLLCKYMDEN
jgi:hypothetical protein